MRSYTTKQIELPGGRRVEVVVFDDSSVPIAGLGPGVIRGAEGSSSDTPTTAAELTTCPVCRGTLVYPVAWEESTGQTWKITLRCPDCEHQHVGDYCGDAVDRFDDALADGTEQLLSDLRTFARMNMEDDVERLVQAIRHDGILPMDF